jgi:ABC-type branched-subunit amino acid transport system ATPase component
MDERCLMEVAADPTVPTRLPGRPAEESLLEVEGVDFAYGHLQVLFDVSVSVGPGEALALLGTNGAGKSTLLRLIAGLNAPTRGRIVFAGSDITGRPAEKIAMQGELALISGGRSVFADMTVSENLDIRLFRFQWGRVLERRGA